MPKKIYLQIGEGVDEEVDSFKELDFENVCWSSTKVFDNDIVYVLEEYPNPVEGSAEETFINSVHNWQKATFGQATPLSKIAHLAEELQELVADLKNNNPNIRLEYADCFLLLFGSAMANGMSWKDIFNAMSEKMEINVKRKWGKPNADGVVNHIKQAPTEQELLNSTNKSKFSSSEQELKEGETQFELLLMLKNSIQNADKLPFRESIKAMEEILKEVNITLKTNSKEGEWEEKLENDLPIVKDWIFLPQIINWIKENKQLICNESKLSTSVNLVSEDKVNLAIEFCDKQIKHYKSKLDNGDATDMDNYFEGCEGTAKHIKQYLQSLK